MTPSPEEEEAYLGLDNLAIGVAIAAFERACTRAGIPPPERYPPEVSGDSITTKELAYPRRTCAAGMREDHGWVCVDTRNDLLPR